MRILLITHYSTLYGANFCMLNLAEELVKKGIQVYVIAPKHGDLAEELKLRNIKFSCCFPYGYWAHRKKPTTLSRLKKRIFFVLSIIHIMLKIYQWRIKIVHTNSSMVSVGAIAARLTKTPHVWHIREMGYQDYGYVFDSGLEQAMKVVSGLSEKIICMSEAIHSNYAAYLPAEKTSVIYDGIPENNVKILNKIRRDNIFTMLLVGLLHPTKGQMDALKAVKYLSEKGHKKIKLVLVGDGEQDYKRKIKRFITANDLSRYVVLKGYLNDLNEIRNKSHIGLMCSRCEAFGLVTVEYMLSKMPVIGTNTGGTKEIIEHNKSGFLYEHGDSKDLAEKIEYFIENPGKVDSFGNAAYESAKKRFSSERYGSQIIDLYREIPA